MHAIEFKDVSVSYGQVNAIKNISFKVESNELMAIIGPNGGGKSTLMKSILGLVNYEGQILVDKNKSIGYVPQFAEFDRGFPILVKEVILSGLIKNTFFKRKYTSAEHDEASKLMCQLEINTLENKQIGELSGGQLQKVLIARALISKPDILLLDEPTASLDVKIKQEIYTILKSLSENVTVMIVTHDIAEIFSYVTSVAYLDNVLHYHGNDSKMKKSVLELTTGCPIEDFVQSEEALMKGFIETEDKFDDQCNH
jgi:zinc transport system ATP-binding protein